MNVDMKSALLHYDLIDSKACTTRGKKTLLKVESKVTHTFLLLFPRQKMGGNSITN